MSDKFDKNIATNVSKQETIAYCVAFFDSRDERDHVDAMWVVANLINNTKEEQEKVGLIQLLLFQLSPSCSEQMVFLTLTTLNLVKAFPKESSDKLSQIINEHMKDRFHETKMYAKALLIRFY